jgi:hypothetical protein
MGPRRSRTLSRDAAPVRWKHPGFGRVLARNSTSRWRPQRSCAGRGAQHGSPRAQRRARHGDVILRKRTTERNLAPIDAGLKPLRPGGHDRKPCPSYWLKRPNRFPERSATRPMEVEGLTTLSDHTKIRLAAVSGAGSLLPRKWAPIHWGKSVGHPYGGQGGYGKDAHTVDSSTNFAGSSPRTSSPGWR